jgi:hypothetical protein
VSRGSIGIYRAPDRGRRVKRDSSLVRRADAGERSSQKRPRSQAGDVGGSAAMRMANESSKSRADCSRQCVDAGEAHAVVLEARAKLMIFKVQRAQGRVPSSPDEHGMRRELVAFGFDERFGGWAHGRNCLQSYASHARRPWDDRNGPSAGREQAAILVSPATATTARACTRVTRPVSAERHASLRIFLVAPWSDAEDRSVQQIHAGSG